MLKIAICDDNQEFVETIQEYAGELEIKYSYLKIEIEAFLDSNDFLEKLKLGYEYDVVFLDIQMPRLNGLELGRIMNEKYNTLIVFISVSVDYFVQMFDIKPFGFLNKPIKFSEFQHVFMVIYKYISNLNDFFEFKTGKTKIRVKLKDIIYFESDKRQVILHAKEKIFKFYGKVSDIHNSISQGEFMFIHKSYLINYSHIYKIQYDYVIMSNGDKLNISERKRKKIRQEYIRLSERYVL